MSRENPTPGEDRIARAIAFFVVVGALSLFGILLAGGLARLWDALL